MSYLHKIAFACFCQGIGAPSQKKILAHFKTAENFFSATIPEITAIEGIGLHRAQRLKREEALLKAEQELEFIQEEGIEVLWFEDEHFPQRLLNCIDTPLLLFKKGNADLNKAKHLSIVGTRRATRYGKKFVEQCMTDMPKDISIISGLAAGIDTYAHHNCVEQQICTVGVLGHGFQTMYPVANKKLTQTMQTNGAILTEYTSQHTILPTNFAERNRIVAALSDGVVVVESAKKGGALITADIANGYNKDVFALPGRFDDKYSKGCNYLIKTDRAHAVENTEDILGLLGWIELKKRQPVQRALFIELEPNEQKIVDALQKGQLIIDEVAQQTELTPGQLNNHLLSLELEGIIEQLPGKIYRLS